MRLLHMILNVLIGKEPRPRRVLVLGAGRSAWRVARIRQREGRRSFTIVGYVPTVGDIGGTVPTIERIYLRAQYVEFCEAHSIDEIVVAMDDHRRGFPLGQVNACRNAGISVVGLGSFLEREGRGMRLHSDAPRARSHAPLTHVD
jgi:hypothetical protein